MIRNHFDYPELKRRSLSLPAQNAFLPVEAIVPMLQHQGKPAILVVQEGERVREGQIIGRQEGNESVNVHSPIPGIVTGIRNIFNERSEKTQAVIIRLSGQFDRLGRKKESFPWKSLSWNEIVHIIQERGVVAMDGSGKPLAPLLRSARNRGVKNLLVLAHEREPYIANYPFIYGNHGESIAVGCDILSLVLSLQSVTVACEPEDILPAGILSQSAESLSCNLSILDIGLKYPYDSEPEIIDSLAARMKTKLPKQAKEASKSNSWFVTDIETVLAIAEAVVFNKSLMERYLTVSGNAIKEPRVLRARIGMKVGDVIAECGGFAGVPERLVLGGPLMGNSIVDLDMPVSKTTRAILALTREETNSGGCAACIRCGRCHDACPVNLEPSRLLKLLANGQTARAFREGLETCNGCGACAFVCPSRIPLKHAFVSAMETDSIRSMA